MGAMVPKELFSPFDYDFCFPFLFYDLSGTPPFKIPIGNVEIEK
jgi:hypothetical protein